MKSLHKGSYQLSGEELDFFITHSGAHLHHEVLQHRYHDQLGGVESGEVGVEDSLLGTVNELLITSSKESTVQSTGKMAINDDPYKSRDIVTQISTL